VCNLKNGRKITIFLMETITFSKKMTRIQFGIFQIYFAFHSKMHIFAAL